MVSVNNSRNKWFSTENSYSRDKMICRIEAPYYILLIQSITMDTVESALRAFNTYD